MLGALLARRPGLPARGPEAERVRRAFRAVAAASAPPLDEGRPPARSAREVGLRVVDAAPGLGPAPRRLVDLYHAARYGPADVPPESAAAAEALAAQICASMETPVRSKA
jgi:hypothetical protein